MSKFRETSARDSAAKVAASASAAAVHHTPSLAPAAAASQAPAANLTRTSSSGDEEFERKKESINLMMEITKQDKDACMFYLESADWNLEKAIETFTSMSS